MSTDPFCLLTINLLCVYFCLARSVPSIYQFRHIQSSSSDLSLTCDTRTVPPTEITWQRNGVNLTVDGRSIQMSQSVTNRHNSHFTSTITIHDDPDNVIGNYTVIVGNSFGQTRSSNISIRGSCPFNAYVVQTINFILFSIGIVLISDTDTGTVGNRITFNCSSDLDPLRIEWYRENTLLSRVNTTSSTITLNLISTDDEGAVYTCSAIGRHGSQERNKTLNVKGTIM